MEYAIWSIVDAKSVVIEILPRNTCFFVDASSLLDSVYLVGAGCALALRVDLSAIGRQSSAETFVIPVSRLAGGIDLADSLIVQEEARNAFDAVHCHKVEVLAKPLRANARPIAQSLPFLAAGERRGKLFADPVLNSVIIIFTGETISGNDVVFFAEGRNVNTVGSIS